MHATFTESVPMESIINTVIITVCQGKYIECFKLNCAEDTYDCI